MKTMSSIAVVAVLVLPSQCFALWEIVFVSKEEAKKMDMKVRSTPAGPDQVAVELEFKIEGELKNFSRVDLRLGKGEVTAALREDRSKPGRVVVGFAAD